MMAPADSRTPAAVRWAVLPPVSFCDAPDAVGARLFSALPLLLGHHDYFPEPRQGTRVGGGGRSLSR